METYDFWTNLFAAYRASPDLIKVLWLLIPPGFLLALLLALQGKAAIAILTEAIKKFLSFLQCVDDERSIRN